MSTTITPDTCSHNAEVGNDRSNQSMNTPAKIVELSDDNAGQDSEEEGDSSSNFADGYCESEICSLSETDFHSPLHFSSKNNNSTIVSSIDKDDPIYTFNNHEKQRNVIEDSHTSYRRSLDTELTELKLLFAEAQARADTLQHKLTLREKSCTATESKLKEVTSRCEELETRNHEIAEVMNHLQSNANHSALERSSLLVKVDEAFKEHERYVSRYKQFRNENRTLRKEREILRGDIEAFKRDNKALKKENDQLKRKYEDNGYSTASSHKPLSHYLRGIHSGGEKSPSRSSRRRKRMTKSNGRDFFRPPWTSSVPQSISSNLVDDESQDESFFGDSKSKDSKGLKIITPSASRKQFPRIGSTTSFLSLSQNSIFDSSIDVSNSSAQNMTLTPSRIKSEQFTATQECEGYISKKPVDIQAGMGSEIYDNDAPSPVPEKIRQTDKSQWRWNWFGSISNPSNGQDGLMQTPKFGKPDVIKDEESTCKTQESIIQGDVPPIPAWLDGASQMLLPKRLATAGT